ncbi:MAG: VOC family protein [Leucobacter sp.]
MSIPRLLDHIVIAGPDLDALVSWFAERTGVTAAPGGAHPTGTANALVALTVGGVRGPQYIELIGPDPAREQRDLPATFGIDRLDGPSVQAYAVHPEDIEATVASARERGYDPGDVWELSRRTPAGDLLEWRLSGGADKRLDVPFLIDWGATPQPGLGDIPAIELVSFERIEPDPEPVREALAALGLGDGAAGTVEGETSGYHLVLRTADGETVEF